MSDPAGKRTRRKTKLNCFPEGPDSKCFVIFVDFHFNSNKRITGAGVPSLSHMHPFIIKIIWDYLN